MFGKRILSYWDDIVADLSALVAIPSVRSEARPGEPYGAGPAEALRWFERRAASLGLKVQDIDHRAGHAEYGEGKEYGGVLVHLDVVPAGEGWETNPFKLARRDGVFYGRGVEDNKSYAVIALHCLRALRDAGVAGSRRMRVIFGADEECGMSDMEAYFKAQPLPEMAFTPDVAYTVCNREKGILQFELAAPHHPGDLWVDGGGAVNAVPDQAKAVWPGAAAEEAVLRRRAEKNACRITVERREEGICVVSDGTASHAMEPEKGVNAVTHLLLLLHEAEMDNVCRFVENWIGTELDGNTLQIRCADAPSGPLTLNLGYLHCDGAVTRAGVDIRYPVTADGIAIWEKIQKAANQSGVESRILHHQPPLYLPEDHPLIRLLVSVYEDVTGEKAVVFSTGGGTYARALQGRGVGFGGSLPGRPGHGHTCREQVLEEDLRLHAQICLEAMYRMMTQ